MKTIVVDAMAEDGLEMLELIEGKSSGGAFELVYTKRPDAYSSFKKESENVKIGLIKDSFGKIAVQFACVVRSFYINGEEKKVGYVCNVRRRDDYKGILNWKRMSDYVKDIGCDLYLCSFLSENKKSLEIFTRKKRSCFPDLFRVSDYTTFIINPKVIKVEKNIGNFRKATKEDLPKIHRFINDEGRKYNFAPVVNNIEKEFSDLTLDNCYLTERNGEILAFGALWNQTSYKQYIVKKYNGYMKYLKALSKLSELLGYIQVPKENETLKFPTLSLFYAKNNNRDYYKSFLYNISREVMKEYKFFVIGISGNNPNIDIFKRYKSLNFQSEIYFVKYENHIDIDDNGSVSLECGFL